MNIKTLTASIAALAGVVWLSIADAAPMVTQQIEPARIALGGTARLIISASGSTAITPPMVPGLEFEAVAQSQRVESVNGVTRLTGAVTYQVSASQPGVFTIPSSGAGSEPLVLTVTPNWSGGHAASAAAPASGNRARTDGSSFVRLRLAKHNLYVGETVPVDIQVGVREGIVVSLNGLPTLNGDAFTLNKLSSEPQRSEEVIGGKPFTVFTWHSALAAVKPGALSLTMAMPLTERVRTARLDSGMFNGAGMEDLFNDPAFQNFFGGSTEKDVTAQSVPANFTVLALPTEGRPTDFSGAVGRFTVSSALSETSGKVGDPLTLSLHVSGAGNFDRVSAPMLTDVENWKSYAPTATFKPEDDIGYQGEKTFEQPLIATQAGPQVLPALAFSWFDPTTQRYETAHTAPLSASISLPPGGAQVARESPSATNSSPANPVMAAAQDAQGGAFRPDHVDTGDGPRSLLPDYYRPAYLAAPSTLIIAFLGAWGWVRRREQAALQTAETSAPLQIQPYLKLMEQAGSTNDAGLFFKSARAALQILFAPRWHLQANAITESDVETHLGANHQFSLLFTLADQSAYAGVPLSRVDFAHWKRLVDRQIHLEALS
jgi:hypothetical protein